MTGRGTWMRGHRAPPGAALTHFELSLRVFLRGQVGCLLDHGVVSLIVVISHEQWDSRLGGEVDCAPDTPGWEAGSARSSATEAGVGARERSRGRSRNDAAWAVTASEALGDWSLGVSEWLSPELRFPHMG